MEKRTRTEVKTSSLPEDVTPNQNALSEVQDGLAPRSRGGGGPRTTLGKERSRRNALRHGILAPVVVLASESRAEFNCLWQGLREHYQPEGMLENTLVEKLACSFWRYRRMLSTEGAEITSNSSFNLLDLSTSGDSTTARLDRLLRYETTLDHAIDRLLGQIERAQRVRLGQSVPPPIKLDIS